MKKITALLLALLLCLSATSSLSLAEGEEAPVTLTFFHAGANVIPSNILDNPIMNQIAEETGVQLDWSPYMGGGTASDTAAMAIASNDYPDIWLIGDTTIITKLLEYGLVMPLDDLIASAPHVQEIASEAISYARFRFNTEESYMIPAQVGGVNWYPSGYDMMISYRYDLWKEMGSPALDSYDAFIDYLLKCKELEPENKDGLTNYGTGLPLAAATEWYYVDYTFLNAEGKTTYGPCIYDWETDELSPRYAEDSLYFEGAKFWYRLNQLGLLDPESATMTLDQTQAKGQSYRYFFGVANWQVGWPNDTVRGAQAEIAEKPEAERTAWDNRILNMGWVPLEINDGGDYVYARIGTAFGNGTYYLLSSTCKDPEAAMRFIDYMASYEGAELCGNGPEGYNWHYVDGVPTWYTQEEREAMEAEGVTFYDNNELGIAYVAPLLLVNGNRQNPKGWPTLYSQASVEQFQSSMSNGELAFVADNGYAYGMEYIDANFPNNTFDKAILDLIPPIDSTSDLAIIATDTDTLAYEYTIRLIYARDDAEFEQIKQDFLQQLDSMGYDELVDYYITNYETVKATSQEWGF